MAYGIDEKYNPINATQQFPNGTSKVFCWFQWKDATINTPVTAKWVYVTGDIPVLNYTLSVPRKEGSGGIALAMPQGKTLPAGSYKVTLESDKKASLKSVQFTVLEK